jgi:hypothetical protein
MTSAFGHGAEQSDGELATMNPNADSGAAVDRMTVAPLLAQRDESPVNRRRRANCLVNLRVATIAHPETCGQIGVGQLKYLPSEFEHSVSEKSKIFLEQRDQQGGFQ